MSTMLIINARVKIYPIFKDKRIEWMEVNGCNSYLIVGRYSLKRMLRLII